MSKQAVVMVNKQADRNLIAKWAEGVPVGTKVTFQAPRRTGSQNDYLWPHLREISKQVDWYGRKLSPDDWKDMFTASLRKARVVPGIDEGTFVPLGMRTSTMSKSEMSDLLELINAFAAEHGVVFSDEEPV